MSTQDAAVDALLLAGSGEILLLIDGETLNILAANPAALTQLGYASAQLIGQPIGEFECALSDMFFWDEVRALDDLVSSVQAESALRHASGQVLDVSKSVRKVSEQPLRYCLRATPAARHNRVEAELANMGSRLRATLEATADGILLVDQEGSIINMNQRFSSMWNLPESLLVNRDDAGIMRHIDELRLVVAGDDDPLAAREAQDERSEDEEFQIQYLRDGRVFERNAHTARSGVEVIGRVYSYRDITERFRTQTELIWARDEAKRASAAKGEFLAMMSHEIRTPMNGVLGIAELLAGTDLNEEQADFVRVIRSSGETLLAILNDILDFSKIEAGKLELERTDFALIPLLEEINALFRFRLKEGGPTFSCTVDGAVPPVLIGDPVRLRQILFNLVGNAFKFTERGSIVLTVRLLEVGAGGTAIGPAGERPGADAATVGLRFSIRDTGIGMTPEQCGRMFRSFEQADNSTTRKYGGTGLGLAICKRLSELMDGEIGVNSQVGEGSEFWFTAKLGVSTAQKASSVVVAAPAPDAPGLRPGIRILLVEDNLINRKVMSGMLKKLGSAEPTLASDGQEALDRVLAESFDLILMDTQMPVMDGLEATRRIRAAGLKLPIIGVSAGALEEERAAAFAAGVDDYVLKPVNLAILDGALRRALARSSAS